MKIVWKKRGSEKERLKKKRLNCANQRSNGCVKLVLVSGF